MLKLATLTVGALAFDFTAFDSLAGTPPVRRSDAPRSNPPAQRAGSSQSYRQQCELDKGDPAVPSDAQSSVWFVQARGACHDWCMDERGEKCASAFWGSSSRALCSELFAPFKSSLFRRTVPLLIIWRALSASEAGA